MIKRLLFFILLVSIFALSSCDDSRFYEQNNSFEQKYWLMDSVQKFKVDITDNDNGYTIYLNVRNSSSYAFNNIFIDYTISNPQNKQLKKELANNTLFDPKTGKPLGQSGIGDVFDHQFKLQENYKFDHIGVHTIELQQYMRKDTLAGIYAVGIRLEKHSKMN